MIHKIEKKFENSDEKELCASELNLIRSDVVLSSDVTARRGMYFFFNLLSSEVCLFSIFNTLNSVQLYITVKNI